MTTQDNQNSKIVRKLRGIVTSNKMEKTIVVEVDRTKVHPKYKKRYVSSKKYKVHDPENKCFIGDYVEFRASKPISKDKRWKLIEILKAAPKVEALPEVASEVKHKEREDQKKIDALEKKENSEEKETSAQSVDETEKSEKVEEITEDKQ